MKAPAGLVARANNADSVVQCRCGHEEYYLLTKLDILTGFDVLVAIHCAKCNHESIVPLDKEVEQKKFVNTPKPN